MRSAIVLALIACGCGRIGFDLTADSRPRAAPLLAFPFEEGTGLTTTDVISGVPGQLSGASWTQGRFGIGVSFDGSAWIDFTRPGGTGYFGNYIDHVEVSVELYARPTAFSGTWSEIYGLGGCLNAVAIGHAPDGSATAAVLQAQAQTLVTAGAPLPLGVWTHLAVVKTTDALLLYQDGVEVARTATNMPWNTGAGIHIVGSSDRTESSLKAMCSQTTRDWFTGDVDEIRFFDQALAPEWIAADMLVPI